MELEKTCNKIISYSFYLLFFLTPLLFSPFNYELFEYPKMMLVYVLTVIITTAWLGKMFVQGKIQIKRTPLDIPILLYLIASVFSTVFSLDQYTSIWGYYSRSHGGLMSTTSYILLYYAFVSNAKYKILNTKYSLRILLISGFLVASYGILERFGIDAQYWVQDVQNRVFSTLGQPNWLGAFLTAIIFIPLGYILKQKKPYTLQTTGYWLLYTIYYLCLIFTNSKSAILAFWLSFILFLFLQGRSSSGSDPDRVRPLWKIIIASLLIYLLLGGKTYSYIKKLPSWINTFSSLNLATPGLPEVVNPGVDLDLGPRISESSEIRKVVWQGAIKVWQKYPWFGSGLETFGYSYYNQRPVEHNLTSEWDFLYNKAHNEFLNILACQGIVGLFTYLGVIGTFIVWSLKKFKMKNEKLKITVQNSKLKKQKLLTLNCNSALCALHSALLAGYISILITNFFGFSVVVTGLLFWMIPAFCFSLTPEKKQKAINYQFSLNKYVIYFFFAVILSSLLFTFYCLLNRFQADIHFNKGEKLYKSNYLVAGLTELEQAVQLNPQEALYTAYLAKTSAKLAVAYSEIEATGSAQISQQLADLAEKSINRTLQLNKVHLNFWKNKAEVYLLLAYLKPELKQKAKGALMEAKRLAPTDAKILYNLGLLEEQDKNFIRAIYLWEKAVLLKPNYEKVYLQLAETYLEIGEKEQAENRLRFVLENINPQQVQAKEMLEKI